MYEIRCTYTRNPKFDLTILARALAVDHRHWNDGQSSRDEERDGVFHLKNVLCLEDGRTVLEGDKYPASIGCRKESLSRGVILCQSILECLCLFRIRRRLPCQSSALAMKFLSLLTDKTSAERNIHVRDTPKLKLLWMPKGSAVESKNCIFEFSEACNWQEQSECSASSDDNSENRQSQLFEKTYWQSLKSNLVPFRPHCH